jgi:multicomponent Na+:H+ antiporter subunit B
LKYVNIFILVVFCGLMFYAAAGLPNRGDPDAPLNRNKSAAGSREAAYYYILNAKKDAHTDNMVTVILADYRGYDTLGEETVIFTAGLICFLLLRKRRKTDDAKG